MRLTVYALFMVVVLPALACSGHAGRPKPGIYERTTLALVSNGSESEVDNDAIAEAFPASITILDAQAAKVTTNGKEFPAQYIFERDSIFIGDEHTAARHSPFAGHVHGDTIELLVRGAPATVQGATDTRVHMRFTRRGR